ncbi:MAG: arylamine N-acetyltransferase, partial [Burkholderiaceae bacterium]|nr:arylamine N-acetyltransferase [Burkholderiaceae bacterium]
MINRLSEIEVKQYLQRLRFEFDGVSNEANLCALQSAHLRHIPFENLDIHQGKSLDLNTHKLFEKLILARRGGICYELNGLFSTLLSTLGFTVSMLSARVFSGDDLGPNFDHMLLLVTAVGKKFIVDVGFGDSFLMPLDLDKEGFTQSDSNYAIDWQDSAYVLIKRDVVGEMRRQYRFTLEEYDIAAFDAMCQFHQTSATSHFTQKSICSIATENGRTTISNGRLIKTDVSQKIEFAIIDAAHYANILQQEFGFSAQGSADLTENFH